MVLNGRNDHNQLLTLATKTYIRAEFGNAFIKIAFCGLFHIMETNNALLFLNKKFVLLAIIKNIFILGRNSQTNELERRKTHF